MIGIIGRWAAEPLPMIHLLNSFFIAYKTPVDSTIVRHASTELRISVDTRYQIA